MSTDEPKKLCVECEVRMPRPGGPPDYDPADTGICWLCDLEAYGEKY